MEEIILYGMGTGFAVMVIPLVLFQLLKWFRKDVLNNGN